MASSSEYHDAHTFYISSPSDLKEARKIVGECIFKSSHACKDSYGASGDQLVPTCQRDVRMCDHYILLLGGRYGFCPDGYSGLSVTELEFDAALESNRSLRAYFLPYKETDMDNATALEFFRKKIMARCVPKTCSDLAELSQEISALAAKPPAKPASSAYFLSSSRSDWSWPTAFDFGPYRHECRKGFVGREWLLDEVQKWAQGGEQSPQALLIRADYGVGKTSFLAQMLDNSSAGLPVAVQHFCGQDNEYSSPGRFVKSLATQLAEVLPEYKKIIEADGAKELRDYLIAAAAKPTVAFEQAVAAPLGKIKSPGCMLIVVDALDEALDYRAEPGEDKQMTIVRLLADHAQKLPPWLKLLLTSRRKDEVLKTLRQPCFPLLEINAEEPRNIADLRDYAKARCEEASLADKLKNAGLDADMVAAKLASVEKSSGKFLYVVKLLDDIDAPGGIELNNQQDLDRLPAGLDKFYMRMFERRFLKIEDYAAVKDILGLITEQREPLGYRELAAIMRHATADTGWTETKIAQHLKPMKDLLRLRSMGADTPDHNVFCSFDHLSLKQWLAEKIDFELRAGRFAVETKIASDRIREWCVSEAQATPSRAHTWPYLARHLLSHLHGDERSAQIVAGLLRSFSWLQARVIHADVDELLEDFHAVANEDEFTNRLKRVLQQAAIVLRNVGPEWLGKNQLASQLLARLVDDGDSHEMREQARYWLDNAGGFVPLTASLARTHDGHAGPVWALAVLPDGRLASSSDDRTVRVWDMSTGACARVLEGHERGVRALAVLPDMRLASGSHDGTVRLWDLSSTGKRAQVLQVHPARQVCCLASLPDGRLVLGLVDGKMQVWDLSSTEVCVLEGHTKTVWALALLPDGRVASCSGDKTVRVWDMSTGQSRVFDGHTGQVVRLSVLSNKWLVSGACDCTMRLWDVSTGACARVLRGHAGAITALRVLPEGRLVSFDTYGEMRLWDISTDSCVLKRCSSEVMSSALLLDGRIALGASDGNVQLWDLSKVACTHVLKGHSDTCHVLAVMPDGRVASGATFGKLHLLDVSTITGARTLKGHTGHVTALTVLPDGRLASGAGDGTVRLWDPSSGACARVLQNPAGTAGTIIWLAALPNGRLVSHASDHKMRLWKLSNNVCERVLEEVEAAGEGRTADAVAVLPDGRLAMGWSDGSVHLWNLSLPIGHVQVLANDSHMIEPHGVTALASLPDDRLASGSVDGKVRLWDLTTGTCTRLLKGRAPLFALSSLPDGRLVSIGGQTLRLWDFSFGSNRAHVQNEHPDEVIFVADAHIRCFVVHPSSILVVSCGVDQLTCLKLPSTEASASTLLAPNDTSRWSCCTVI